MVRPVIVVVTGQVSQFYPIIIDQNRQKPRSVKIIHTINNKCSDKYTDRVKTDTSLAVKYVQKYKHRRRAQESVPSYIWTCKISLCTDNFNVVYWTVNCASSSSLSNLINFGTINPAILSDYGDFCSANRRTLFGTPWFLSHSLSSLWRVPILWCFIGRLLFVGIRLKNRAEQAVQPGVIKRII